VAITITCEAYINKGLQTRALEQIKSKEFTAKEVKDMTTDEVLFIECNKKIHKNDACIVAQEVKTLTDIKGVESVKNLACKSDPARLRTLLSVGIGQLFSIINAGFLVDQLVPDPNMDTYLQAALIPGLVTLASAIYPNLRGWFHL
jgi:hypothetical protein